MSRFPNILLCSDIPQIVGSRHVLDIRSALKYTAARPAPQSGRPERCPAEPALFPQEGHTQGLGGPGRTPRATAGGAAEPKLRPGSVAGARNEHEQSFNYSQKATCVSSTCVECWTKFFARIRRMLLALVVSENNANS
jgi:hypothetical protein